MRLLFCSFLMLVVVFVSLNVGAVELNFSQILTQIFTINGTNSNLSQNEMLATLVFTERFYRVVAALVVGAALSLSGALFQAVLSNPLTSPSVLGVTSGAGVGAGVAMVLGFGVFATSVFCFLGGLLAFGVAYGLAFCFDRARSTLMLILAGIITGSVFGAVMSVIKLLADPYNTLPSIVYYLMGSLANFETNVLFFATLVLAFCVVFLSFFARRLDLLNLDEQSALSLGLNVRIWRFYFVVLASLLASVAVSLAGVIGWVGLVVPHMARFLVGAKHAQMTLFCAIFGGTFLLLCDTFARSVANVEVPLGIATGVFGIPAFVVILLKRRRHGRGE